MSDLGIYRIRITGMEPTSQHQVVTNRDETIFTVAETIEAAIKRIREIYSYYKGLKICETSRLGFADGVHGHIDARAREMLKPFIDAMDKESAEELNRGGVAKSDGMAYVLKKLEEHLK